MCESRRNSGIGFDLAFGQIVTRKSMLDITCMFSMTARCVAKA